MYLALMKKMLLFLAFATGFASAARAQQGVPYVGVKAGFNLATYTGGGDIGRAAQLKPGFGAGGLAGYGLSARTALQVEALYAQKGVFQEGYAYFYPGLGYSRSSTYRATLSYLDVPVLFRASTRPGGQGVFVEVGPQVSFALGRREYVRPTGEPAGTNEVTLDTDRRALVPVGLGYVGGLGYQLANGLGVAVRYSGDFTNVYKAGYGAGQLNPLASNKFHNGVLQVQVHFRFGAKPAAPADQATAAPRREPWVWHGPRQVARPRPPLAPDTTTLLLSPEMRYRAGQFERLLRVLSVISVFTPPPVYRQPPMPRLPTPSPAPRGPLPARPVR